MSGLFRRLAERASEQRQPMLRAWVLPVFLADDGLIEDQPCPLPTLASMPLPPQAPLAPTVLQPESAPPFDRHEQPAALVVADSEQHEAVTRVTPSSPITPSRAPAPDTRTPKTAPPIMPQPATERWPSSIRQPASEQTPPQPSPLLLMPVPVRIEPATPAFAAFNPPPAPAAVDEVHVHIGRIEVTTVREQAPAKHSARTPQPALSLDDYLAKRRGQQSRGEPS